MIAFDRESALLSPVSRFARKEAFRHQRLELPFYEYRIDLYGFSSKKNLTVAIELKLTRWRRAFEQALIYQLCADIAFVALPQSVVHRVDIALLEAHGIGLLSVQTDGRCKQLLTPLQSGVVRAHYRDDYVELLRARL
jgi:hypothetical protein